MINETKSTRTKLGNILYEKTYKASSFLYKHMWLYYLLNYTWGIIITLIGWVAIAIVYCLSKKMVVEKGKFGPAHYAILGNNWGGVSLGINFFVADKMGKDWTLHTKKHELGHTFQNAIFGPFAIFLIYIPSCIRYWYREFSKKVQPPYDLIWFEGSATEIGTQYISYINKDKEK